MEKPLIEGLDAYCPHCGAKQPKCDNPWFFGSPIRECPICHKEYYDSRYKEIALEGRKTKGGYIWRNIGLIVGGVLIFGICTLTYHHYPRLNLGATPFMGIFAGAFMTVYGAAELVRETVGYDEKIRKKQEIESYKRLEDPEYALKLKDLGIDVPEIYLRNK